MTFRFVVYVAVLIGALCSASLVLAVVGPSSSAATVAPDPTFTIPFVVPGQQGNRTPSDFYAFSWSEFFALNWPAKTAAGQPPVRGVPDEQKTIGDPGMRVWETWKSDFELFPRQPGYPATIVQPTAWESWDVAEPPCTGASNKPALGTEVLPLFAKGESSLPGEVNQAMAGPLVDQHLQYVRYGIKINQAEYDETKEKQWFLRRNLSTYPKPPNLFSASTAGHYGAIEIKAAWRILTDAEARATPSRFYTVKAWVADPSKRGECSLATVGLVGLHIAHKTNEFSGWVWSTFEQVDNVPGSGSAPPLGFSFNKPSPGPVPNWGFTPTGAFKPVAVENLPLKPTVATLVWRVNPIREDIAALNESVHALPALKGTVWQFYELVDAQWQTAFPTPVRVSNPATSEDLYGQLKAFPQEAVANVTMETFFQGKTAGGATNRIGLPTFGTSCVHCHYQASQYDFSWVMADAAWPSAPASAKQFRPRVVATGAPVKR